MNNKISIEQAERLSPQELVDLIISNVPFNNIRHCLSNLDTQTKQIDPSPSTSSQPLLVPPRSPVMRPKPQRPAPPLPDMVVAEAPPLLKASEFLDFSKQKENSELFALRDMCKGYPILIVETNKIIPNQPEPQIIYYARSVKDKKFKKFMIAASKFTPNTCKKLAENIDIKCQATIEWIDEQVASGKNIDEIKNTINSYMETNVELFMSDCGDKYTQIMEKLDLLRGSKPVITEAPAEAPAEVVLDNLTPLELSTILTPISDYLIYTKSRAGGKIRVGYYNEEEQSWMSEDKDISFIEKIKNSPPFSPDTPPYRVRMNAFQALIPGSPKHKNLLLIINNVKSSGITLPYDFLNVD